MICGSCMLVSFLFIMFVCLFLVLIGFLFLRISIKNKIRKRKENHPLVIGLFHPYCNAGGGGERVLWTAVKALNSEYEKYKLIIYTGDTDATVFNIIKKVKTNFNIVIQPNDIELVYLKRRNWVEAKNYPYCTLLGQSLGSMFLGIEALYKYPPDILIETMGYAFILPLFKYLGKCKTACYVHYPTISSDMLKRVQNRYYTHNNSSLIVRNPFLTWIKIVYYRLFAWWYGVMGRCADTVMVNSSWTENHIIDLWNIPFKTHRVYPPCEVNHLKPLQHTPLDDKIIILSLGQFRPEKDHPLQLQALYELRTLLVKDEDLWNRIRLVIVGSCRNDEDLERMENMKDLSKHLALENNVEFKVNVSYQELIQTFQLSSIAIHTMWNEHFGIGIVECMAAGLIVVANRSGGPLMDIIETSAGSQTGYLAVNAVDYAQCIYDILLNTKEQNENIRVAARASVDRFSEKEFIKGFLRALSPILD